MYKAMFAAVLAAGPDRSAAAAAYAEGRRAGAKRADKKDAKTETKAKKPPSAGMLAARERQKKCGAEWKAAKAAGKIEKGMKWPQYWSACNKRLKAGG